MQIKDGPTKRALNGASVFGLAVVDLRGTAWVMKSVGDSNGDGSDILMQNSASGALEMLLVHGLTATSSALAANPGASWMPVKWTGDGPLASLGARTLTVLLPPKHSGHVWRSAAFPLCLLAFVQLLRPLGARRATTVVSQTNAFF